MAHEARSVAVVGGGITGLAAAHRLWELDPTLRVRLFEAAPRLGGVLETVEGSGFLNEHSADSFITNVPWALDLCRRVALGRNEKLGQQTQLSAQTQQRRGQNRPHLRWRHQQEAGRYFLQLPATHDKGVAMAGIGLDQFVRQPDATAEIESPGHVGDK